MGTQREDESDSKKMKMTTDNRKQKPVICFPGPINNEFHCPACPSPKKFTVLRSMVRHFKKKHVELELVFPPRSPLEFSKYHPRDERGTFIKAAAVKKAAKKAPAIKEAAKKALAIKEEATIMKEEAKEATTMKEEAAKAIAIKEAAKKEASLRVAAAKAAIMKRKQTESISAAEPESSHPAANSISSRKSVDDMCSASTISSDDICSNTVLTPTFDDARSSTTTSISSTHQLLANDSTDIDSPSSTFDTHDRAALSLNQLGRLCQDKLRYPPQLQFLVRFKSLIEIQSQVSE